MTPLVIALITILALLILLALAGWFASGWMLARRSPDPPRTPSDLGLSFEKVIFPSRDGIRLQGRLISAPSTQPPERRAAIIFCAGMFGSMDGDTDLVPIFVEAGFDVLQFDWRAHGASEGNQGSLGLREPLDVLGALDSLELRGIRKVGLMGFSFGGAVALRAAALDRRPMAVACDGPFVKLSHAIGGVLSERYGGLRAAILRPVIAVALIFAGLRLRDTLRRAEPIDAAAQVSPRPVLMIHGHDDPIVPLPDQDELFRACGDPRALWRVDGAGHREAHQLQPDEYRKHLLEFFRAHLS
jgi:fermentation-respiration switch protein FrsA (DUF1100 family)